MKNKKDYLNMTDKEFSDFINGISDNIKLDNAKTEMKIGI